VFNNVESCSKHKWDNNNQIIVVDDIEGTAMHSMEKKKEASEPRLRSTISVL
jgi:hypothetical protein